MGIRQTTACAWNEMWPGLFIDPKCQCQDVNNSSISLIQLR